MDSPAPDHSAKASVPPALVRCHNGCQKQKEDAHGPGRAEQNWLRSPAHGGSDAEIDTCKKIEEEKQPCVLFQMRRIPFIGEEILHVRFLSHRARQGTGQ